MGNVVQAGAGLGSDRVGMVPYLENHAQYTCLRNAEAFLSEVKLSDRWVVALELGHWNATELLQRLAFLLEHDIAIGKTHLSQRNSIALTTATWASLAAASPVILGL